VSILEEVNHRFELGRGLAGYEAELFLDELIGTTDADILGRIFRSWNRKGISAQEIYEIARVMADRCTKVSSHHETLVDIVGTGGSRSKTFNVSTAAAFVIAGSGVAVAKHGNRAATSSSGSADVLSELGVDPAVDAATADRCLDDIGMCFMFAPNFHRLSPTLAKVRRELGFPTIFNCVGPLCNPARASHRLIGVWDIGLVPKVANALALLGTSRSWIVHGHDGADEISLSGPTSVAEVVDGQVREFMISPEDFGIAADPNKAVRANSPEESGQLIREILLGDRPETSEERSVLLNAAAGIYLAGMADGLEHGFSLATESIRSNSAIEKLNQLAEATPA
jgi:anthranilate phosphoribosyltransferase